MGRLRLVHANPALTVVLCLVVSAAMSFGGMVVGSRVGSAHSDPNCSLSECLGQAFAFILAGAFIGFIASAIPAALLGMRWFWMPLTLAVGAASLLLWAPLGDLGAPWLGAVVTALVPIGTAVLARPQPGPSEVPAIGSRRG